MTDLKTRMLDLGQRARAAAMLLREAPAAARTRALEILSARLKAAEPALLAANARDVEAARANGMTEALIDRLSLSPARIAGMAEAVATIAAVPDPLGVETERWTPANGLDIARVRTPIGVLGVIYESRPNVTADAAALCIRSGNAAILRCGSDCLQSSLAIAALIAEALAEAGLPADAVQLVDTPDREAVGLMLTGLSGAIDVIVPRGGKSLVARVQAEARTAVLSHLEGLNHTYLHEAADLETARAIVLNAKMRRVSVCGATETLLVDRAAALRLLPPVAADLIAAGCELRGDEAACALVPAMTPATEADWTTEYLAPILAVRVVDDLEAATDHIARYGSGHTEAIVTTDAEAAERFAVKVDSAIVLINASTQFADGGEFGFGGEIGISTNRLHARGPVGAEQLTTYKYVVRGQGQIRP
ncbi:MAG: glutamate-5-semialdehyde dehydrogenase [Brevundimonas sp.]|jgi:glutamate-5-semialdehyde dehydrogenase|uniref:glutamate-5-semialdehyde dehydrogenase n=1 Tax=Brevundimonas sp. GW460-12-10-14-LB2 TaxID=1827469 RepID=UPI0007BCE2E3|nr:glutamate-5-semialdehyde dehydrogenase [Brevundimonas sp. GW460-12-10-14-LB2]ANC55028.1 gamma-glutamyl-phosphate reductase [Brevundimonas sp. GW460-12-10-14-LB2]MEA3472186.1 glutamate-5-semialdehyde dehydrogenase [Pseudomonadota bacterium]